MGVVSFATLSRTGGNDDGDRVVSAGARGGASAVTAGKSASIIVAHRLFDVRSVLPCSPHGVARCSHARRSIPLGVESRSTRRLSFSYTTDAAKLQGCGSQSFQLHQLHCQVAVRHIAARPSA
jgi:hypothetical protein